VPLLGETRRRGYRVYRGGAERALHLLRDEADPRPKNLVNPDSTHPKSALIARSPDAERMRRHRERRRDGLRCLVVELRETEIDVLVQRGLLNAGAR
jgi:hypothetical protein